MLMLCLFVFAGFFQQFGTVKRLRIARNRKVLYSELHDFCVIFVI